MADSSNLKNLFQINSKIKNDEVLFVIPEEAQKMNKNLTSLIRKQQ